MVLELKIWSFFLSILFNYSYSIEDYELTKKAILKDS